jgi:hypothetical protein
MTLSCPINWSGLVPSHTWTAAGEKVVGKPKRSVNKDGASTSKKYRFAPFTAAATFAIAMMVCASKVAGSSFRCNQAPNTPAPPQAKISHHQERRNQNDIGQADLIRLMRPHVFYSWRCICRNCSKRIAVALTRILD